MIGLSAISSRLLAKLLVVIILVISMGTVMVWVSIDFFAFDYFTHLLDQYHVPKKTEVLQMFLDAAHRGLLWAALLSLVLGLVLGFLLLRRVLTPLRQMIGITAKIAQGDFTSRVGISSRDEIAGLGNAFNVMADRLQRIENLRRKNVIDVAHELRAPLTNIRGYLEAFSNGVLEPVPETIASLHEEVLRLSNLAEDLMRLSVADAARSTMVRSTLNLRELLLDSIDLFRHQFAEKEIVVEAALPDGVWEASADAEKLAQIYQNLLDNAWRYTPRGGRVRVVLERAAETFKASFQNTGDPIPQQDLELIFERFYRVDKSRSREHGGGTGIGLAIVKELVEAHGGRVGAETSVDGNCIFFTIPVGAPG